MVHPYLSLFFSAVASLGSITLRRWLALVLAATLIGCTGMPSAVRHQSFVIDRDSYHATGKSERIKFIVVHYTVSDNARALRLLTTGDVSAHYLILDRHDPMIYQLVPETKRAWHAGDGGFAGRSILNDTSIGIEVVNPGIKPEYRHALEQQQLSYHPHAHYVAFDELQIKKLAYLIQDIAARYDIAPQHIIGHADLAPSRKIDPGAKFPWQRLYNDYGIGAWYDEADKREFMRRIAQHPPAIAEIKQALRDYGYHVNDTEVWDKASRDVVYAFQLHFRPQQPTGDMDLETYAILKALNKKYAGRDNFY